MNARAAAAVAALGIVAGLPPAVDFSGVVNATLPERRVELDCLRHVRLRDDLGLDAADRQLHSYNPSIVPLDDGSGGFLFLARASNLHSCDGPRRAMPSTVVDQVFALAILDDRFAPVPRTEALVSVPAAGAFGDCRLGVGSTVICNGGRVLRLSREAKAAAPAWACDARLACPEGAATLAAPLKDSTVYALAFEDAVRWVFSAAARVDHEAIDDRTKNVNLLERAGALLLEVYPLVKRRVLELDLPPLATNGTTRDRLGCLGRAASGAREAVAACHSPTAEARIVPSRTWTPPPVATVPSSRRDRENRVHHSPAWLAQQDRVWQKRFLYRAEPRGGACCVETADAFLGVGHYRGRDSQYVQYAYAFSKDPPFPVTALSQPFCVRHHRPLEKVPAANLLLRRLNCPRIEMIMTIRAEGDEILLGLGANDCDSFAVRMARAALEALLEPIAPLACDPAACR